MVAILRLKKFSIGKSEGITAGIVKNRLCHLDRGCETVNSATHMQNNVVTHSIYTKNVQLIVQKRPHLFFAVIHIQLREFISTL